MFAGVLKRTGSIWIVALLHALWNFLGTAGIVFVSVFSIVLILVNPKEE